MSLLVVRSIGLVTTQDLGRPGYMHVGLARGGAIVPALLAAANRRAQNPDDAAAIEVMGALTVRAEAAAIVATDTREPRELRAGDEMLVTSGRRRVTYLAMRGGVNAPVALGSRSTQLSAGIGRLLRAGDRLAAESSPVAIRAIEPFDETSPVRVIAGPDADAFSPDALNVLESSPYSVLSSSDRVGTRLDGPRLDRTGRPDATRPMVVGAIEVPRDGQPIVLGPEHPTTGGYPVIGVVASADLGRLFARPFGSGVRFTVARQCV